MDHITEYSSFYKKGDIVVVEYWYNNMLTPVVIVERGRGRYRVSHNTEHSRIRNAPEEWLRSADIIDGYNQKDPAR